MFRFLLCFIVCLFSGLIAVSTHDLEAGHLTESVQSFFLRATIAATLVLGLFFLLLAYCDARNGKARLVVAQTPILTGGSFSGEAVVPKYNLTGQQYAVTLQMMLHDVDYNSSTRETVIATGGINEKGESVLRFAFAVPDTGKGIFTMGVIWRLLVKSHDGRSGLSLVFSSLPVFPGCKTARSDAPQGAPR